MGTRSIVAAHTEKGVRGVYVHWDGYPEGRVPVLEALIARDGVGKVLATILGQPHGWSHLSPNQTTEMTSMYSDGRFVAVPGYGVQYAPYPVQGNENYWTPEMGTDWAWAEYIYLVSETGDIQWADLLCDEGAAYADLIWHVEVPA